MKNKGEERRFTSFEAKYRKQNEPQYPYILASSLQHTNEQLEQVRAMKMLGQWIEDYEQMSELRKLRYSNYLPRIQKILLLKYQEQAPIQYCLARFLLCFYASWKQLTYAVMTDLAESDKYALGFLQYTCYNLVENINLERQQPFLKYLTFYYEEQLRFFRPQTEVEARRILYIIYLMNIHGCQQTFARHAQQWSYKMQLFENASIGDTAMEMLMDVLRNRLILYSAPTSRQYWLRRATYLLQLLEKQIKTLSAREPLDIRLMDTVLWLVNQQEVKELLIEQRVRYQKSLLANLKPNANNQSHIFHLPKYAQFQHILYKVFYEKSPEESQKLLNQILDMFISHSYNTFGEQDNYTFLDCLADQPIAVQVAVIDGILKILSNNHNYKMLTPRTPLILAKVLFASLQKCVFTQEMIGMCFKAYDMFLNKKEKERDPMIGQFRGATLRLFLGIMERFTWEENQARSNIVFTLCQNIENNEKFSSLDVLQTLCLLVRKFGFALSNIDKMEPVLADIQNKIIYDDTNIKTFISLMLAIYFSCKWPKAVTSISQICSQTKSVSAPFFVLQAGIVISNSVESQTQLLGIIEIVEDKNKWSQFRVQVNLMQLQIFFMNLSPSDCFEALKIIDQKLLGLFKSFAEDGKYQLIGRLAAKTLPAAGNIAHLHQLQSYLWLRQCSFDMLSSSFYKTTIINICYAYSNIILRAQNTGYMIKELYHDQFLHYLYQGLNDFVSKEKKYSLEVVSSLLFFKLITIYPALMPANSRFKEFTSIFKNVDWWDEANNPVIFSQLNDKQSCEWLLPEFQKIYEETMRNYLRDYLSNYGLKTVQREKELKNSFQGEEDIDF